MPGTTSRTEEVILREEAKDLLLEVWREACRHIEIGESTQNFARLIAKHLPIRGVTIRRVHAERKSLELVGRGQLDGRSHESIPIAIEMRDVAWRDMVRWAKQGVMEAIDAASQHHLKGPVPLPNDHLIGPLNTSIGMMGLLVLDLENGARLTPPQRKLAQHLLEPLSVALENDRRLRELSALRQAAEAERMSLLSRLGRQSDNEEIVGSQTGLRHVMERVALVAPSDVPVLILGETGTGKEVVARAIHTRSPRAGGPFIRVNCGAIPPELIDSQLFGHEKGSFTGAADQHQGWFERADGGTLFLDEIGELPLVAQVRLLRVLQDHQIERVGGRQPIHVDVRIVAATHRDLASMVKAGSFREDLWYRINVFPMLLPKLMERIEDIPALVRHLVSRASVRFCLPAVEPTPEDIALLSCYSWPGNIRELGAVIDRAMILGNGKRLEVASALGQGLKPTELHMGDRSEVVVERKSTAAVQASIASASMLPTLDDVMLEHIRQVLTLTRGRVEGAGGAAERLGINPHTLRARMRKHRLDWTQFRDDR